MSETFMVLPASDCTGVRVLRIPDEFERHEAYRRVTGLIAQIEEDDPDYTWEDIACVLEEHGFEPVEAIIGPTLD